MTSAAVKRFYAKLAKTPRVENLDIPHSHVYYARWLIWEKTGVWFDIDHVQISMWLEGMINPKDMTRLPEWYVSKFMGGKQPNMYLVLAKAKANWKKYQERLKEKKELDLPR